MPIAQTEPDQQALRELKRRHDELAAAREEVRRQALHYRNFTP